MNNPYELKRVSIRLVEEDSVLCTHPITHAEDAVLLIGNDLKRMDREVLCIINLKSNGNPINYSFVSIGALNSTLAHPRELLKASILSNAASMILIHCHPSGSLIASRDDITITDRMIKICELIGIPLLDHIIVAPGTESYYSMRENNQLNYNCFRYTDDKEELLFQKVNKIKI